MKDSKIATLEAQRISLLHKLESLSEEQLKFAPAVNSWSIVEILEHIILSEELSVNYALKKVQAPQLLTSVKLGGRLKGKIMNVLLNLSLKFKASEMTSPKKKISMEDLKVRWEGSRTKLENLSSQAPDILDKGIMKHPRTGYLNFSQLLDFFSAHYAHHLKQINDLVESGQKENLKVSVV